MNKRSPLQLLETLTVLIPGGIGLYIVARALGVYWGRDWPASVIVCAMALALAFGLVELLFRQRAAGSLELEVGQLPSSPSEASVDAASPVLSALLRARLEQAPGPNLGESVAPFLTGLLVMLGLLGTLLGLFETVRGASLALTSSTDVDALRRSLTTPIEGLTRSFGCSAAGISASAMLGLAVALVRRRESRVLRAVQRYASGPLRVLSPARRQARAIEQLAGQGAAMPDASLALAQVGVQLGTLSERLVSLQESALETQKRALTELLAGLRSELGTVASEAGASLHQRVAPLLQESLTRMDETVRDQASALADVAQGLSRELSADAGTRRSEATEWVASLGARIDAAERARSEAHQAELETLGALASKTLLEAEARERGLDSRWGELIGKLDGQLAGARAEEGERLTRLDALTLRVGQELSRLSAELGAQAIARREGESAHDERALRAAEQLESSARALGQGIERQEKALEQGIERQEKALEQLVACLPPLFVEAANAAQTSAAEALARLMERTDQRLSQVSTALGDSLARLVESTDGRLERVSKLLSDERSERQSSEGAHDLRARAALERLELSSGLLDESIARQGSGLEQLVERVGGLLAQLTEAAQERAQATLARLAEGAEEQGARFAKLSSALESGRAEHAQGLEARLSEHALQLEERLSKTSALVQDAAASWQASTVEMQAVADLFAKSVDRQREASDAWLESLGEVEGAVERAGKHAARDALSDQLASTQEVFARQLQFQRELFEQLRSLRTVTPRGTNGSGEHDVSV